MERDIELWEDILKYNCEFLNVYNGECMEAGEGIDCDYHNCGRLSELNFDGGIDKWPG